MSESGGTVLIVDDDIAFCEALKNYLEHHGYPTMLAKDGREMRQRLTQHKDIQMLLLDLRLPEEDGFNLIRWLRAQEKHASLPIFMLSASGDDVDRIVSLEMGADDYLTKPPNFRELLARVRALLRRINPTPSTHAKKNPQYIFGDFMLDMSNHRLSHKGQFVPLTTTELHLLAILASHPNRVLTRDELMHELKGYDCDPYDRTIDIHISRLRAKIESNPSDPVHIRTVRGKGYLFSPEKVTSS